MDTKKKKVCAIMGVVLGVGCYVSVQGSDPKTVPPRSSTSQKIGKPCSMQQQSPVVTSGQVRGQKMAQIKKPSQTAIIEKLLAYLSEEVEDRTEIDPDVVNEMFAREKELGCLEYEGGTNIFHSPDAFLGAGFDQARKEKKWREADVISIRRYELKRDKEVNSLSMDDLLKRQRFERLYIFFLSVNRSLDQLSSGSNKKNGELVEMKKKMDRRVSADLESMENEDRQFNKYEIYNGALDIAKTKENSAGGFYFFTEKLVRRGWFG